MKQCRYSTMKFFLNCSTNLTTSEKKYADNSQIKYFYKKKSAERRIFDRSDQLAPPQRNITIYFMPHFRANYGLILGGNANFQALVFPSKNRISGGGADCPISQHLQYIKNLKFKKLTIPEFRAIFGLLKYPKINFEKTTPITYKQSSFFKDTFSAL